MYMIKPAAVSVEILNKAAGCGGAPNLNSGTYIISLVGQTYAPRAIIFTIIGITSLNTAKSADHVRHRAKGLAQKMGNSSDTAGKERTRRRTTLLSESVSKLRHHDQNYAMCPRNRTPARPSHPGRTASPETISSCPTHAASSIAHWLVHVQGCPK